jgi:ferredoxin
MSHKISVNKEKCIGCGACVAVCNNFVMKSGKASVKKAVVEKISCEEDAKNGCPVGAIKIE